MLREVAIFENECKK